MPWNAAPDKPSGSVNWRTSSPTCWVTMLGEKAVSVHRPSTHPQRITSLEQRLVDAAAQLAARDDDLDAARSANGELMAQLNHLAP